MKLITGGLGFIGSHLSKRVDAKIFDRKDPRTLENWNLTYDTIFHLAASTYLATGYDRQIIEDNIILSNNILIDNKTSRIVYASSAAIYNPNNLYSYSKKYCEDLFGDSNSVGLRYYNVYGHGDNGVVGKLIYAAYSGNVIRIYGGNQTRDFVYIDDVIDHTLKAEFSKEKIIEIGTGVSTSINELIKIIEEITGKYIRCSYEPAIEFEATESRCENPIKNCTNLYDGLNKTIMIYQNGLKGRVNNL